MEFENSLFFEKLWRKSKFSLKSDMNKRLIYVKTYVKVKKSLYRPGQAGSFPGG